MRAFVILLLLCAIVSAGLFDINKSKLKEKFKALKGKLSEKVKTALDKLKEKFDTTALTDFREKLAGLKDKIRAKLTLTKEKLAEVAERLKMVKRKKIVQVQAEGDSIDDINSNAGVAEALYQSDIVLTKEQSDEIVEGILEDGRSKRQAFRDKNYPQTTWPNRKVPYGYERGVNAKAMTAMDKAAKLWTKDTCIDIYRDNTANESIRVINGVGCWSYAGKTGGRQNLSLGQGCETVGTAAHELGHALGFFHTHSRHDRDQHITVVEKNIDEDWLNQFTLQTKETNDNYGLPYDYGSLMQYAASSGTKEKKPTTFSMIPNQDMKYIDTLGSHIISFIDLYMMNVHYNCTDICPKVDWARCRNHGFPHPRDCSRCICPGGYGGDYCDERPKGCGEILEAEEEPKIFEDRIGSNSKGMAPRYEFDFCHYWIQAPPGKKIRVTLVDFEPEKAMAVEGCTYGGVEFKWQADQRLTGSRHCSPDDVGYEFTSTSNIVPVITYSRIYASTTKFQYKIV
ncbi:hypothetical protein Q1695_001848 [Nippostrongylus brasiliensis]|nr:hypothetical protein Q1695_001848 [Nippostrongylus brasiliensis]